MEPSNMKSGKKNWKLRRGQKIFNFRKKRLPYKGVVRKFLFSRRGCSIKKGGSVTSKQNFGTLIFNWNDLYDLQRNIDGLYSY